MFSISIVNAETCPRYLDTVHSLSRSASFHATSLFPFATNSSQQGLCSTSGGYLQRHTTVQLTQSATTYDNNTSCSSTTHDNDTSHSLKPVARRPQIRNDARLSSWRSPQRHTTTSHHALSGLWPGSHKLGGLAVPLTTKYYSSTTKYYPGTTKSTPILQSTTKYYSTTTPYYKSTPVLQSTTQVLLQYYKVLQYYSVLRLSRKVTLDLTKYCACHEK